MAGPVVCRDGSIAPVRGLYWKWAESWMWSAPLPAASEESLAFRSPERIREFQAGRHAAQALLKSLGSDHPFLPVTRDRRPVWPFGWVGSISHSREECIVVVGSKDAYRAVGVDIEPVRNLSEKVTRMIATDHEHQWLSRVRPRSQQRVARLLFSAKESFYKCFYNTFGEEINFREVSFSIDPAGHRLHYRYERPGAFYAGMFDFKGEYWQERGHFVTLFWAQLAH